MSKNNERPFLLYRIGSHREQRYQKIEKNQGFQNTYHNPKSDDLTLLISVILDFKLDPVDLLIGWSDCSESGCVQLSGWFYTIIDHKILSSWYFINSYPDEPNLIIKSFDFVDLVTGLTDFRFKRSFMVKMMLRIHQIWLNIWKEGLQLSSWKTTLTFLIRFFFF